MTAAVLSRLTHEGVVDTDWTQETFDKVRASGMMVYSIDRNGEREQVHKFDPDAEQLVAVPALQGG